MASDVARPLFSLLFVVAEKQKNKVWTCEAMYKSSYGGRLAQCVRDLARALVNCGRSINIATFSTQNLWEQGRKSYVASYQVNKELMIP